MFLSLSEIEKNINWLTEHASPSVAYLTNLNLLHANPESDYMRELWKKVEADPEVMKIFSLQNLDGSWFSGGPWGPRGYRRQSGDGFTAMRPKFVTTAWILPFLGEIGFRYEDERIKKGADFILSELYGYEDFSLTSLPSNCCGINAVPLWGLASIGLGADERLKNEWIKLIHCQRTDGGWLNPNHLADSRTPSTTKGRWPWDRSCVWGSYYVLRAFQAADCKENIQTFTAVSKFLCSHLEKQNPEKLKTWVYHGHNIVRELEIFSNTGIDMNLPFIQTILGWLREFYKQEEGVFRIQDKSIPDFTRQVSNIIKEYEVKCGVDYWKNEAKVSSSVLRYGLYHLVEEDWLTYRLTHLAMKMHEKGMCDY